MRDLNIRTINIDNDSRPSGTLEELRAQPRNEIPRVKAYPFTLLKKNGVTIPYTAEIKEIARYIAGDMVHFEAGIIALVWRNNKESFDFICREFRNEDYYKRKCALEYIIYHDLFKENLHILGFVVLDRHEIVVKSALDKIYTYNVHGLKEELEMVLEVWQGNDEICRKCCIILSRYGVDCSGILKEIEKKNFDLKTEIYEVSSQRIVNERMERTEYYLEYLRIVHRYFPGYEKIEIARLFKELADEGCGYAVLAAVLVHWYVDKEEEFYKTFCFPIKNKDGYAVDKVMLDFYCMTDEPGRGMYFEEMQERFSRYCSYYNISGSLKKLKRLTAEDFKEYAGKGYILLYAGYFTLSTRRIKPVYVEGWHVMNVCDIQKNGIITVATWGKQYDLAEASIRGTGWHYIYVEFKQSYVV